MDIIRASLSDPERLYLANFVTDVLPRGIDIKLALYDWLKENIKAEANELAKSSHVNIERETKQLERCKNLIEEFCD